MTGLGEQGESSCRIAAQILEHRGDGWTVPENVTAVSSLDVCPPKILALLPEVSIPAPPRSFAPSPVPFLLSGPARRSPDDLLGAVPDAACLLCRDSHPQSVRKSRAKRDVSARLALSNAGWSESDKFLFY